MSLNNKLDKMFEEDFKKISEEDLEEENTTASAGGEYDTPKAFVKKNKDKDCTFTKRRCKEESVFVKLAKQLNEISYKAYKTDESLNSKQKVNKAIKEVAAQLYSIERTVNQNIKLKTEDGVSSTQYWKSTRGNLRKISERMMRISERLRRF